MQEIIDINDGSREFNAMQRVKRRFFAMRNGAVAQQMADYGGKKYQINFGLNLPQITAIARDFLPGGKEFEEITSLESTAFSLAEFARKLRDNRSTRESMLIAPMLFPVAELTVVEAIDWAREATTPEVADILCLKLLRNFPLAIDIVEELLHRPSSPMDIYSALRLLLNLLQTGKITAVAAEQMLNSVSGDGGIEPTPLTHGVLRQLREEIAWC